MCITSEINDILTAYLKKWHICVTVLWNWETCIENAWNAQNIFQDSAIGRPQIFSALPDANMAEFWL